jgi:hypothetical protein
MCLLLQWVMTFLLSLLLAVLPIQLSVNPHVTSAPATVVVTVRIPPSPANRSFAVVIDGSNYYATSEKPLDGANAPGQFILRYVDLPSGEYTVSAGLDTTAGLFFATTQTVLVN